VLGLFDAYGYDKIFSYLPGMDLSWLGDRLFPEAPLDRAPYNSIMRNSGWDSVVTPTEIEMLLWACRNSRLQLYTKSIATWLGAEVSQAFFD
jgi:hypothetical protein